MMPDLTLNQKLNAVIEKLLNSAEAVQAVYEASNRIYNYKHDAVVAKSLEETYEDIIAADNEKDTPEGLGEFSAVGFTALLKDGDTITVQNNRLFINGTEETSDYSFSGGNSEDGSELVNVWYFEKNGSLDLSTAVDLLITEIDIRAVQAVPNISSSYFNFVQKIKTNNFALTSAPNAVQSLTENGEYYRTATYISPVTKEYTSDMVQMWTNFSGLNAAKTSIETINLPNLVYVCIENTTTLVGQSNRPPCIFFGLSNPNLKINMPNVEYINGAGHMSAAIFSGVINVEIPEKVKRINGIICCSNGTIKLYCKDAEAITDNWCYNAPTSLFYMCPDWGASINISTAAANWVKDDFLDLFENKLRDMGSDTRTIKIPTAIYNNLTAAEIAIATAKGWTITHP